MLFPGMLRIHFENLLYQPSPRAACILAVRRAVKLIFFSLGRNFSCGKRTPINVPHDIFRRAWECQPSTGAAVRICAENDNWHTRSKKRKEYYRFIIPDGLKVRTASNPASAARGSNSPFSIIYSIIEKHGNAV
jgi:hypothetical protein